MFCGQVPTRGTRVFQKRTVEEEPKPLRMAGGSAAMSKNASPGPASAHATPPHGPQPAVGSLHQGLRVQTQVHRIGVPPQFGKLGHGRCEGIVPQGPAPLRASATSQ